MTLEAIKYENGKLMILDQLKLPLFLEYIKINSVEDGFRAIKEMNVRGAPAIAIVGCLTVAVAVQKKEFENTKELAEFVKTSFERLVAARPTAVNMTFASKIINLSILFLNNFHFLNLLSKLESEMASDVKTNKLIGDHGAAEIVKLLGDNVTILTHCNTGSLATAGYGTALGVIRSLQRENKLKHVFCTETRPYNQGARLTAYELVYEKIPATLIADSMVSAAIKEKRINCIVVGADRVAKNGDSANKIGTFQLAVVAKYFGIPFFVAAPFTTIDFNCENGDEIVIEERDSKELTEIGGKRIAAEGIQVWNPAFDVAPANLIEGIITERGVFKPNEIKNQIN
ncbi:unnamed protein product [Oikopleura dioica]|uniref:Methylthioribose-1-phosphate isomerase n=1 Tax=Oikopleura dioica TaxID=34765 RepID=E4Y7B6_OIKDI|nr:unnamed protein product [Oikopleura dioica]